MAQTGTLLGLIATGVDQVNWQQASMSQGDSFALCLASCMKLEEDEAVCACVVCDLAL